MKVMNYKHFMLILFAVLCFSAGQATAQSAKRTLTDAQTNELREKLDGNPTDQSVLIQTQKVTANKPKVLAPAEKKETNISKTKPGHTGTQAGKIAGVQRKEPVKNSLIAPPNSQPKKLNTTAPVKQKELRQKQSN